MIKEYLYIINYQDYEKSLCDMEMKYIFGNVPKEKYIYSKVNIKPSRSAFIKHKISIIYSSIDIDNIVEHIRDNKIAYNDFKVNYIKSDYDDIDYNQRLQAVKEIGFVIIGFPDIHNPKVNLAITKINNNYIFGEYEKNDLSWQRFDKMPHSYSNGLSLKMARAIINIAVQNNLDSKVIDPCCGIGTVVLEGLDLGIDIKGIEISKQIAHNARNNIEFFGYDRDIIICNDMHNLKEKYDIAIIDIPYGIFSPITYEEQVKIIKTSRKIAEKVILISFEDMDKELMQEGFKVIDKGTIVKNRFTRYITIAVNSQ
ncbi:TRM11 family SAM-dependent methyltransferase [Clostridium disporicum]|uniref:Putative DNA modification methylase n=1 Tax=Clostridium disporicum TaxID=84024 RepID=A0A173YC48_9CLOT|nr:RNA methyltransferase [Clostridium disporicum]MDU6341679.1 SAM-dependent methyltransferase [Clostridium sp.]CUN60328.1 putative DNA modification methylase [Clostridium disporicum]